ncbi:MAG TPA: hypothetical protein VKR56_05990 [Candidatus Cybelea sp.]|nr:hypothetical protein [Candidatus Cybelea sp.]
MALHFYRPIIPAAVILLASSGCGAHAVPLSDGTDPSLQSPRILASHTRPADTTSILKKLTKNVTIGSTVDAKNGDEGPRAIFIVPNDSHGLLTKGQLVVCNFEDSSGVPGNGTTIEVLNPKVGATPVRFFQNALIKGCDGDAISAHGGTVYGAGLTSGKIAVISKKGVLSKTYSGKTVTAPISDTTADPPQNFSPLYLYAGTTTAGGILSVSVGFYGNGQATQVAKGFGVSDGSGGQLGPSGLQYSPKIDTLYIVDGVTNTIAAFSNASKLLDKDEITVGGDGKTFNCKYPKTTCGSLVYSGSPLNAPMASALLPNGNLVVANTQGTANTLVELTPAGQVLDTEAVDTSSTQGVFGLVASGTNDSNTVIYYTDANSNTVQELEP